MSYLLQHRRYSLPFRLPMRTAHGLWRERAGVIVRLEDEAGNFGYGEAAPIPGFGTETVEQDLVALTALGDRVKKEQLTTLPMELPCLRGALAEAGQSEREKAAMPDYLPVAALLPAGRAALEQVGPKAGAGFRVFKWKVGVADLGDELVLLDDLCAALPAGAKLRLDANGAWTRRQAERWLERCADRPIEHVEQPVAPEARGADDLLLGLAGDYPTPLALDESLVNDGDVARWIGMGWPGVYVVKPLLLGDPAGALDKLAAAEASVVFSSALETALGAQTALRAAFAWAAKREKMGRNSVQPPPALGFGVWPLFADDRFDGPRAAPFFYWKDIERINPEATWTALT